MATSNPDYLTSFSVLAETVTAAAALAACRCVNRAGAYPTAAGDYVAGVTKMAADSGKSVAIDTMGIAIVEVGAAIAAIDTPVFADTAGKVRPVATTEYAVGRALDTATGTGTEFVRVKLT